MAGPIHDVYQLAMPNTHVQQTFHKTDPYRL